MSDNEENRGARRGAPAGETELASKTLDIHLKRFYIDVKENPRGRVVKIAERHNNHHHNSRNDVRPRVMLSMGTANELVSKLTEHIALLESTPAVEGRTDAATLQSDTLDTESRPLFVDLRENSRGRFVRIAQNNQMFRCQVVFPAEALKDLRNILSEYVVQFGEGHLEPAYKKNGGSMIRTDNHKSFTFASLSNEHGSYVRITEITPRGYRSAISVPASSLKEFVHSCTEMMEKLELEKSKTDIEA